MVRKILTGIYILRMIVKIMTKFKIGSLVKVAVPFTYKTPAIGGYLFESIGDPFGRHCWLPAETICLYLGEYRTIDDGDRIYHSKILIEDRIYLVKTFELANL